MQPTLPSHIEGYGPVRPFSGAYGERPDAEGPGRRRGGRGKGAKLLPDLRTAIERCELRSGCTVSFHHHLRNGDGVLNQVMDELARLGLRDLTVAASSIFPVHAPLVEHIRGGVVTKIVTGYMTGPVADAVAAGMLANPAMMQTHGGRARSIESGEVGIDAAFIAAPAADCCGNLNGVDGPSACGSFGYPVVDAQCARHVVAVTNNLVPYPACPIAISQEHVDFIVRVGSIGDASQIVSGTTRPTGNPIGLQVAETAARVIDASGLLTDGFSFQTGAGGVSLAVASRLASHMAERGVRGSFGAGGITGMIVKMLEAGLFRSLLDVQCFDLEAVASFRRNSAHQMMSASMYANPWTRGAVVDQLDCMILGAAEIDLDFNVNVSTGTDGRIIGGSGGHSDTAAGAKLALVTTQLTAGRFAKIVRRVSTVTTPGETVDAVATEAGIAVNPRRDDLRERLAGAGLPVVPIEQLHEQACRLSGGVAAASAPRADERIVAVVQYRDGSVIDVIRRKPE
ncbi:MAG: citrate lyase subunit alpha [Acetobacteraceae bacterium]|nr:citrate lyase subunit alpha [Acetobacteraceae bacterium]